MASKKKTTKSKKKVVKKAPKSTPLTFTNMWDFRDHFRGRSSDAKTRVKLTIYATLYDVQIDDKDSNYDGEAIILDSDLDGDQYSIADSDIISIEVKAPSKFKLALIEGEDRDIEAARDALLQAGFDSEIG